MRVFASIKGRPAIEAFRAAMPAGVRRFSARTCTAEPAAAKKGAAATGELYIYDAIGADYWGGIGPKQVAEALDQFKADGVKDLVIYVNSPGGDVFDGLAIFNLIKRFEGKKRCVIDGLAASAASVVILAADTIEAGSGAMVMIHDPWSIAMGNAADLRRGADRLDKVAGELLGIYVSETGGDAEELRQLMQAETWLTAEEAMGRGFVDSVAAAGAPCEECGEEPCTCEEGAAARAVAPLVARFQNAPAPLRERAAASKNLIRSMTERVSSMRDRAGPARSEPASRSAPSNTTPPPHAGKESK